MNVDSRIITLALFLIAQSVGAIWWASGLSSEVNRLSGLDVLNFKVEELWKAIDKLEQADATLRDVDNEIMVQHESIFEWMAKSSPEQISKGNPYGG